MVSSPDSSTHLVEQTPANLAIQPATLPSWTPVPILPSWTPVPILPSWTPMPILPSSEAESSEDELNTFASPPKKIKASPKKHSSRPVASQTRRRLFDGVEVLVPSPRSPPLRRLTFTSLPKEKFLGVIINTSHLPQNLENVSLNNHSVPPSSSVSGPSSSGLESSTSLTSQNSAKPPSSASLASNSESTAGNVSLGGTNSLLAALNQTFEHHSTHPSSFHFNHASTVPSKILKPNRTKHSRNAKATITSSTYLPTSMTEIINTKPPRDEKKAVEQNPVTEDELAFVLDTQVAPLSLPGRGKLVDGLTTAALGPELAAGWGPLGSETKAERDRRLAVNLRFFKSDSDVSTGAIEPAAVPPRFRAHTFGRRSTNAMFVERLDEMFGVGGVDRGSTVSKPKGRSTARPKAPASRPLSRRGPRSYPVSPAPESVAVASSLVVSQQKSDLRQEEEVPEVERHEEEESSEAEGAAVQDQVEQQSEHAAYDESTVPSKDNMAMWAAAIYSLAKGKVDTSREKMEYISDVVRRVAASKEHADLELVQTTGLMLAMTYLADLEDAPFEEDFRVVAQAKEVVTSWKAAGLSADQSF
ncbi:hypothetical protein FIBSPDRAFT_1044017 [Athelia psychrophila]|uniref:Uncharacterized protein n=1 Tax=Athelia psychrophila TaxID=1759441 RepID=A0A166KB94_9AGAM|nr:hypothetical protein FIBSPDRAFT_1044017 [Fibularhizoctonia sp. CBS 109695]